MKKLLAAISCVALLITCGIVFTACDNQKDGEESSIVVDETGGNDGAQIVGVYTKADSPVITDAFKKVFDKAMETLTGVEYTPVAYLSSQVVAGTNHRVLCKATPTVPDAKTTYSIVTIYEDLNGNAEVSNVQESTISAEFPELDGGWAEAESPALTTEANAAFTKACETLTGMEYTPVALIATQVVAGTNYQILCEAKATVPNAETSYMVVTVYADLEGNAEITETVDFK